VNNLKKYKLDLHGLLWLSEDEMAKETALMIPIERIQRCIYLVRKHKVMLDSDLAMLSSVLRSKRAVEVKA